MLAGYSQEKYTFTVTNEVKTTPVKNQYRSGTCWSFATISFVETELIRQGKGEYDLSEMFPVRYTYHQRAIDYIRYNGHLNFSGGAQSWDLMNVISRFGIMPDAAYPGLEYGETNHVHGELDEGLKGFVEAIVKNPNGQLTPVWINAFDGIMDAYLGKVPEKFSYNSKEYTPLSFAGMLDFHPEEYVAITSFTHHPYYKKFVFESPDNWSHELLYNLPLDELIQTIVAAIEKGYSVQWSSDISEKGLKFNLGIGIVPLKEYALKTDEEQKATGVIIEDEKIITPEMRQRAFNNFNTTDDHAMHIVGLAKDQRGNRYFKVKNSHGIKDSNKGYLFVSEAFVRYKTMSIMVNKNAIPSSIASKMEGLK